ADADSNNEYNFTVTVDDQQGGVLATQNVTVTVQDLSEAMVAAASGSVRLIRDGLYVQLVDSGTGILVPGSRHLFSNVTSTVIEGSAGTNDTLIVDFSNENPVAPGGLT